MKQPQNPSHMNAPAEFCSHLGGAMQVVNEKTAGEMLDLQVSTLQKWRWLRKGPKYLKLGRRVVYRLQDLEDFLERHSVSPITEN